MMELSAVRDLDEEPAGRCQMHDRETEIKSGAGFWACSKCLDFALGPRTLAEALTETNIQLRRFVVFPNKHGSVALALWIAATHAVDQLDVAPYFLITAPEIESGKTLVMSVAAKFCRRPMFSSSMTPAVLFRTINRDHPTLFVDEADNIWTGRKDDKATELVALLNAGNQREFGRAHRMGGANKITLEDFDVFGLKAIAGAFPDIGNIPEALRSRSVHLRMKRKMPTEKVTRWTRQTRVESSASFERLRADLETAVANVDLSSIHVPVVGDLSDRDFDVWEPLLQLAVAAGGDWPADAKDAAIAMCGSDASQAVPLRIQILRDLKEIWQDDESFMLTADILEQLHKMDERPWKDLYGAPLTAHKLGKYLSHYAVASRFEPGEKRRKGYYRQDLDELWSRYGRESSQTSQDSQEGTSAQVPKKGAGGIWDDGIPLPAEPPPTPEEEDEDGELWPAADIEEEGN